MKVAIVTGNQRDVGYSIDLVNSFIKGINPNNLNLITLQNMNIEFCKGCSFCMNDDPKLGLGRCKIKDDMVDIINSIVDSDIVVFSSPIYTFGVSAQMKKFIERSVCLIKPGGLLSSRIPKQKNKVGIVILTSGAPFPFNYLFGINKYPKLILKRFLKLYGCSKIYFISAGGLQIHPKIEKYYITKAFNLGKKLQ